MFGRVWFRRPLALILVVFAAYGAGGCEVARQPMAEEDVPSVDASAVVDRGAVAPAGAISLAYATGPAGMPTGAGAARRGLFGPAFALPLVPVHQVLLPDGRVLFYGTDLNGAHTPGFQYAVWNPALGTGSGAFTVLAQTTKSTLFCGGHSLLPDTGDVLLIGGSITINGVKNVGVSGVNRFVRSDNTLTGEAPMAQQRWYPTLLTLPDGQQLALGGRTGAIADINPLTSDQDLYAVTPEIWNRTTGWRSLANGTSNDAFGGPSRAYYYPRAWVNRTGDVYVLTPSGAQFRLNTAGDGALTRYASSAPQAVDNRLPALMYRPGQILAMRTPDTTVSINIDAPTPVVTPVNPTRFRLYGNATLLADGQVWMNGGSPTGNVLANAWMQSETWNPDTGVWTDSASATKPRLYHSSSLLLPDGTVLTGGGGAPGPVTNLNAEIYYPPYLYRKDGSGLPADRPSIDAAPDVVERNVNFSATVSSATSISRVTLVRTGAVTHNFDENQRFQDLKVLQNGSNLTLQIPTSSNTTPPGYYMMFVFDANGVPSVAKVLRLR